MKIGGNYNARMEAKDGSFGFNLEATYSEIIEGKSFIYNMGDRAVSVEFIAQESQTRVIVIFDAEAENPTELQKQGWQLILNNFKSYVEQN